MNHYHHDYYNYRVSKVSFLHFFFIWLISQRDLEHAHHISFHVFLLKDAPFHISKAPVLFSPKTAGPIVTPLSLAITSVGWGLVWLIADFTGYPSGINKPCHFNSL